MAKRVRARDEDDTTPSVKIPTPIQNVNNLSIEELVNTTVVKVDNKCKGLLRINAIQDYYNVVNPNFLENIIFKYAFMTEVDIVDASKDPDMTVIERQVVAQLVTSINGGKSSMQACQIVQDRIAGRPTAKIEHTGVNGGPIVLSQESIDSALDAALNAMTEQEMLKYEEAVDTIKSIVVRGDDG
jgi:hypothetical protein